MFHKFGSYCDQIVRDLGIQEHQQWIVVVALVVIAGIFLLRGYGPRIA